MVGTIGDPDRWTGEYDDVTLELVALSERDDVVHEALVNSIERANGGKGDGGAGPVDDLSDYYRFVDRMSRLLPRDVLEQPSELVYDDLLESICYFYFLVDQPVEPFTKENWEHDGEMYAPALQYYGPFSAWLRDFADSWGSFLDTEASWSRKIYREFYRDPRFGLQENWYEPASTWSTFNEFFSRHLRTPDVRPIAGDPEGGPIVVSPADSVPQGVWEIDDDSRIHVEGSNGGSGSDDGQAGGSGSDDGQAGGSGSDGGTTGRAGGIRIKNRHYHHVDHLLGEDSAYADAFAGGAFTHTFLNVNDYHRYHFPVGGTVVETDRIEQNVALSVSWNGDSGRYEPVDSTGWQFSQTRGYAIVDTAGFADVGVVGLVPMGMAEVSSVNFEPNVEEGATFRKGDPLGTFLFGGSDFVMLFGSDAEFGIDAPVSSSSGGEGGRPTYEHVHMGETYGTVDA